MALFFTNSSEVPSLLRSLCKHSFSTETVISPQYKNTCSLFKNVWNTVARTGWNRTTPRSSLHILFGKYQVLILYWEWLLLFMTESHSPWLWEGLPLPHAQELNQKCSSEKLKLPPHSHSPNKHSPETGFWNKLLKYYFITCQSN